MISESNFLGSSVHLASATVASHPGVPSLLLLLLLLVLQLLLLLHRLNRQQTACAFAASL
jgi:hypothetical protein